jgi:hypothetical protein
MAVPVEVDEANHGRFPVEGMGIPCEVKELEEIKEVKDRTREGAGYGKQASARIERVVTSCTSFTSFTSRRNSILGGQPSEECAGEGGEGRA